jgi:arylsulfatase A-like enzyme
MNETTFPTLIKQAGYTTGAVGKWHLGAHPQFHPNKRGFDEYFGALGGGHQYFPGDKGGAEYTIPLNRNGTDEAQTKYLTEQFGDEAAAFVGRHASDGKPWMLYLAFNAPHTPYAAPDNLKANYPALTGDAQTYAAMLESLDLGIGAILAELDAQRIAAETLVVFLSDNGGAGNSPARNTPLRAAKGNVYDGGIRVPALVRWPGVVPAGATSEQFVAAQDWFPTVAAAAGVTARNGLPFDGTDLWAQLKGTAPVRERAFTVATETNYAQFDGRWKLVRIGVREELYDLAADPGETSNQATAQPAVLARLRAALDAALDRSLSAEPAGDARLTNLSARTAAGGAAGTPIVGFVVAGAAKRVLVRGVGPALGAFGVTGALADPALELRTAAGVVQRNDDWAAADAAAMAALGAFALPAGGKDAALLATLPPGAYTALVSDATGGAGGVALAELYDGDGAAPTGRLANASVRAAVGSGAQVLIPGLAVGGTGAAGLLIRAAGPALGRFGVADALADPVIALYRGGTLIASNDDWSGADNAAQIARTAATAGAFAWEAGSRDAALLTTLPAGANYTVQVSGKAGATGTALVELYVVE